MITQEDILRLAQNRWKNRADREVLTSKYKCTYLYVQQILSGNKRMPWWMVRELGYEKVRTVAFKKVGT